ncbi:MAG: hypothetical protein QOE72_1366 [Chloroflexota bacterium]|jgi:hypothetical protein|nr:hypothetical protein [Chloroflexota bacterium]
MADARTRIANAGSGSAGNARSSSRLSRGNGSVLPLTHEQIKKLKKKA